MYFFIVRYYTLFIRVERAIIFIIKTGPCVHVIRNVFGFLYDDKLRREFCQKIESANPAQPS